MDDLKPENDWILISLVPPQARKERKDRDGGEEPSAGQEPSTGEEQSLGQEASAGNSPTASEKS